VTRYARISSSCLSAPGTSFEYRGSGKRSLRDFDRSSADSQVDVFTATPFGGNPVAVVLDSDGLSTSEMQRFATGPTCPIAGKQVSSTQSGCVSAARD
jgi:hypothetical protein